MSNSNLAPIQEIIEEARNGRPYILVDADDRENEGDIIIPAQFVTPDAVNFMATHGRGLICLALTAERAAALELEPMTKQNRSGHGTAFTVSIEAKEGISTGISAHDRARTIHVATDPSKGAADIVSPGHVFPLVAKDGGVLVRAGHTEASVDISRLAGLIPAAVICEVMNEDGTMARLPELKIFAEKHGLKVGAIDDLIAHRLHSETLIEKTAEAPFETHSGAVFTIHVFRNIIDGSEHLALVRGVVRPEHETLVRVHLVDLTADLLGWNVAEKDYVQSAIRMLSDHDGPAVGVFVQDSNPASLTQRVKDARRDYHLSPGYREFGTGSQILKHLGVGSMKLMTSSKAKLSALGGFGLDVASRVPIPTED